jgi:hypothetical protein
MRAGLLLVVSFCLGGGETARAETPPAPATAEVDAAETAALAALARAQAALTKAERALSVSAERLQAAIARVRKRDALRKGLPPPQPGRSEGEQLEESLMNDRVHTPAVDRLRAATEAAESAVAVAQTDLSNAVVALERVRAARRDAQNVTVPPHPASSP